MSIERLRRTGLANGDPQRRPAETTLPFRALSIADRHALLKYVRPNERPAPATGAFRTAEELAAEYAFLLSNGIGHDELAIAAHSALRMGVALHLVLMIEGRLREHDYLHAVAWNFGLPVATAQDLQVMRPHPNATGVPQCFAAIDGRVRRALDSNASTPRDIVAILAGHPQGRQAFVLAAGSDIDALRAWGSRRSRLHAAISGLWLARHEWSARNGAATWQIAVLALLAGSVIGGLVVEPDLTVGLLSAVLSLPFFCVAMLRLTSAAELTRGRRHSSDQSTGVPTSDAALPVYSILVPLFEEAEVVPRLVLALQALDYPAPKLDILLILESSDALTLQAVRKLHLPPWFRCVIVPARGPKTKPKALNYALNLARGAYVMVYDAEDRPDAQQLRDALRVFRRASPDLVCVQARLNIYNPRAGFFTRQFTLEYSALFDAVLPTLERLSLPIPLGGTSNHFRTSALRQVGAWDPFNVTEDADLGIRLARLGLKTATIKSTTWEEAPVSFGNWFRQRTRWLKGWTQTYVVHMRHPRELARDLGWLRFAGFQIFMGGILLSVLVHPLFYLLAAVELSRGHFFYAAGTDFAAWLWWIACINLAVGYAANMLVGALAVVRRGRGSLAVSALAMPIYWLLISAAGYRALWQLVRNPYLWEKTQHGNAKRIQSSS